MYSTKNTAGGVPSAERINQEDIKKTGVLKKLKTMKKKYFVLRMESESGPSRLEYYDSEKKWKAGTPPKRSINLKTCFNINRKLDTKQKFVVALYTKDDSFAISLDNEAELDDWLAALLQLQHGGEYFGTGEIPKPNFEHVWQVTVKSRGLGSSRNILGPYRLCLTERTLSLVQMSSKIPEIFEFPLVSIRRCGNSDSFFFMEVGRSAMTGAGELWMLTEDTLIAQNMHETILNAMKCSHRDDVAPRQRSRSNEASKPISVHLRRQQTNPIPAHVTSRERADSMPTRVRTISDGPHDGSLKAMHMSSNPYRPSSMFAHTMPSSPPYGSVSKSHDNHALDSGESSMSIDDIDSSQPDLLLQKYGSSLTEDSHMETTTEEDFSQDESYMTMAPGEAESKRAYEDSSGYMEMDPSLPLRSDSQSSGSHQRDPLLTSPPLWLALGPSAKTVASSPPPPAHHQPTHGSDYLEMASPGGASSIGTPDGYMPMSPVGSLYAASTTSPRPAYKDKAEKPKLDRADSSNGYVPMAPVKDVVPTIFKGHSPQEDEGYLDMNPASHSSSKKAASGDDMSRRSSGTPSTDICFSEYPLDKVRSYFTPTDEDEPIVRAYSIGSRADCERRNKLDVAADASRTRAFSLGSKVGAKFGSRLSAGGSSSSSAGSSAATPKTGAAGPAAAAEDKGKKSNSAPILGTSPLCNSWTGTSFLHRMHSTSRSSSNQNEDLMEMDFPEGGAATGNGRGSGNVAQGFWPDAPRKSGAADAIGGAGGSSSSTDSLRRTPTGSGSGGRPRTNSRSSHQRPGKLETLQSIGEKSSSKSPPSEGSATEPAWMSPPPPASGGDYLEMNRGAPTPDAGARTAKPGRDHYASVTAKRAESLDKGGAAAPADRKRSLPVSIQGARAAHADPGAGGEYVSIDFGRGGCSAPPQKFGPATAPPKQQPRAVTVASKVSSNPSYASARFPVAAAPKDANATTATSTETTTAATAARTTALLPPPANAAAATKPAPEYVNLQYDKKAAPAVGSTATAAAARAEPPKVSDYAVMSPGKPRGSPAQPVPAASSTRAAEPAGLVARRRGAAAASPLPDADPNGNYAELPDVTPMSLSEVISSAAAAAAAPASPSSSSSSPTAPSPALERQASVASLTEARASRPGSVSSERELNYASLDLAGDEAERSPRSPPRGPRPAGSSSSEEAAADAELSYAKIDFAKSDGLRCSENRV